MLMNEVSRPEEGALIIGESLPARWKAWISQFYPILVPTILLAISAILFGFSISQIKLSKMSDLGLISVLPMAVFLAGLILTSSYIFCLSQPGLKPYLLVIHIIFLLFLLSGIPPLVEEVPRFNVTWRHAGIVEAVNRLGEINPRIDAYFNWPVFFILSALLVKVSGLQSALSLAPWAPVFFGLLYLGPLIIIFETATQDKRQVWLGIWIFYLANSIGQDYFSPQALNLFLYMVLMAILLRWFRVANRERRVPLIFSRLGRLAQPAGKLYAWLFKTETPPEAAAAGERKGLLIIWIFVVALVVSSHQLTPFAVFLSLTTLVIFNRVWPRFLPFLIGGMIVAWVVLMAGPYFRGNMERLLAQIGQLGDAVNENVTKRLGGSPGHALTVQMRVVMTLGFWGLAMVGFFRRFRKGRHDATLALLAFSPFVLLGLQAYGGEMLLRVYLFSLPFMAFFTAGIVFPDPRETPSWRILSATGLVCLLFLGGFYLTRYGNEKMEQFTTGEVEAVRYFYKVAEPGALIAASSSHYPAKFENYEKYLTTFMPDETLAGDVNAIADRMKNKEAPSRYLILTRSQGTYLHLFYGMTSEAWDQLVDSLKASPKFRLIYSNQDAQLFLLVGK